jgi:5-oxopent-3-ene-1,2,5-tricarboxylate decarboxylase/2-hydroxyhepta-2,4-diene-1,7-dioate isomerase
MKRARVAFDGQVHEATPASSGLRLEDGRELAEDQVTWLPPVTPGAIYAVGLNYSEHAAELSFQAPKEPLLFLKGPNSLTGHRGTTPRPAGVEYMHYECELAVVIGRPARKVRQSEAYDYVRGYTVANDYAIRDYLENWYRPNLRVKSRDRSTPLGPWLVDRADIADPLDLHIQTRVNGKVTQQGNTRDMIFHIAFLIEYLSAFLTLQPGDLILTGTPPGLADCRPGDQVVTEIENVGQLLNTIE